MVRLWLRNHTKRRTKVFDIEKGDKIVFDPEPMGFFQYFGVMTKRVVICVKKNGAPIVSIGGYKKDIPVELIKRVFKNRSGRRVKSN